MPLLVQESSLQTPTQGGTERKNVYKLTGLPFAQEFRRDLALWGLKLEFIDLDIAGPIGSMGISFSSRYQVPGTSSFKYNCLLYSSLFV